MVAETKLYDALGIKPSANQQEIKKAYRYVQCYKIPSFIIISCSSSPPLLSTYPKENEN